MIIMIIIFSDLFLNSHNLFVFKTFCLNT